MSCITEILKIKGDRDVMVCENNLGKKWIAVEGGGTYKNYEYLIVLNSMGHRCGYVAIKPGHPYDIDDKDKNGNPNYNNLEIDVHGGLTFMSRKHSLKKLLTQPCTDQWIGFDCGHFYDLQDIECLEKYYGEDYAKVFKAMDFNYHEGVIRNFDFVKNECMSIIDQLIEKENIKCA